MSTETFDDFDSNDLALQLTEMAANRRQMLELQSRVGGGDSLSTDVTSVISATHLSEMVGGFAIPEAPILQQGGGLDDLGQRRTPMSSPVQQPRPPVCSPPQDLSMATLSSGQRAVAVTQVARNLRLHHPLLSTSKPSANSSGAQNNIPHTSSASVHANSFNLEDFLIPQSSSNSVSIQNSVTINPSTSAYTIPLSLLPSCSFGPLNDAKKFAPSVASVEMVVTDRILPDLSSPSRIPSSCTGTSTSSASDGAVVSGVDFSALLAAYDSRRNATVVSPTTVTAVTTPSRSSPAISVSASDDKEAEALMQRMINEGRLVTKRPRTSTPGSRSSSNHDLNQRRDSSASSATCSAASTDDMTSILVAAAAGSTCGLNLSLGSAEAAAVKVKQEMLEAAAARGDLIAVGGATAKQFDNLYLAYTAAMAVGSSGDGSGDGKASQGIELSGNEESVDDIAEDEMTSEGGSVDAQASQAARLAMRHFQLPASSEAASSNSKASSRRHTIEGGGKTFHCMQCSKAVSSMHNLKLHEATVHRGLFQYRCPLCGKGLRQERDLRGHLANRHNMKKDFRCSICGNEFGYKRNLKQHMVSYHGWKDLVVPME